LGGAYSFQHLKLQSGRSLQGRGTLELRVVIPSELHKFLDEAKGQGSTDEVLVGLLRGRGWPEQEVHRALADHYEAQSGLRIPIYKRSGSAKDAFLYLVSFATLATWTYGLGSVMFELIDRWIKDSFQQVYYGGFYQMANSLAAILVAFPVYLVVMRYITRELERHPEKQESGVRKWLTYIALFVTAALAVGDLITFLTAVLRGELSANFSLKASVVLVITGGIFWYYFGALKQRQSPLKTAHE
jgi:hypothetical protein